jgi:hypothetical protein
MKWGLFVGQIGVVECLQDRQMLIVDQTNVEDIGSDGN